MRNIRVSGLRVSSRSAGGDHTASCNVHYNDGSTSIERAIHQERRGALRLLFDEVKAIDAVEAAKGDDGWQYAEA